MTSRPGELRHEEFSHCCIHESLLETKLFSSLYADKTLAKKNLDEPCFIIFPGQSLKCVWQKGRTNNECKRKGEKLFEHVISCFFLFRFFFCRRRNGGKRATKRYSLHSSIQMS